MRPIPIAFVALVGLTAGANAQCATGYTQLSNVFACQSNAVNVWSTTLSLASGGWQGYDIRQIISSSDLLAATGTNALVTIKFASTASAANLDAAWIGEQQTSPMQPYNFDGNQVQLKFSGATSVSGITGATTLVSDPVAFTYSSAKNLIVSLHVSGTAADTVASTSTANEKDYYLLGTSQAGVSAPTGTWTIQNSTTAFIPNIAIQ